eukprot:TRINITY_DN55772_c0_g1_i1.p1 TRINITY_DN55772_c0_g1~~TRINITY_DN55772_c0_g1_i1.p1  ORF type:complete len:701 (-),score=123.10 TRINITY_DN55772_c0_g1_i1:57-2159(-)
MALALAHAQRRCPTLRRLAARAVAAREAGDARGVGSAAATRPHARPPLGLRVRCAVLGHSRPSPLREQRRFETSAATAQAEAEDTATEPLDYVGGQENEPETRVEGTLAQKDVGEDSSEKHSVPMRRHLEDGSHLWPFISPLEEALSEVTSGPSTDPSRAPWLKPRAVLETEPEFSDVIETTPADLVLLARALRTLSSSSQASARKHVLRRLRDERSETLLQNCSQNVLAALISSLYEQDCDRLLRQAVVELLKRTPLQPRPVLALLGVLGTDVSAPPVPVLRAADAALKIAKHRELLVGDITIALEGLSRLREGVLDEAVEELLPSVAAAVVSRLCGGGGGGAIMRNVVGFEPGMSPEAQETSAIRLLASLHSLYDVVGDRRIAGWLAASSGNKWPTRLYEDISEDMTAAAACSLARCGAWSSARCDKLLFYVLQRNGAAEDTFPLPASAGAKWLCAIAQAGVGLDEASKADNVEAALLASIATLAPEGSGPAACDDFMEVTAVARSLWALHALGKAEGDDSLAGRLRLRLAETDPKTFSAEALLLLSEVLASGDDVKGEAFGGEKWEALFAAADAREARHFETSGRLDELRAALAKAGEGLEEPLAEIEEMVSVGPYKVSLRVGSLGVLVDFDAHGSPVSRVLRRRQWEALAPEQRVAEITLAQWDAHGTRVDPGARAALLQRRLLGVEDPQDDEDED